MLEVSKTAQPVENTNPMKRVLKVNFSHQIPIIQLLAQMGLNSVSFYVCGI